ncbi:MAG: S1C family serine protease [Clostridiales bacterium]|nr:S1C family serine protease [Clostridiales bacterium]
MKKVLSCFLIIIFSILIAFGSFATGFTDNSAEIEKAAKSVLMLFVYKNVNDEVTDFFATGSGFVAFNSSTLVTNYHVIESGKRVLALDDDNNAYELDKVLCADKNYDIAMVI